MNSFFHFIRVIDRFLFNNFVDCLDKWFKWICAIHFRFMRKVAHKRNWLSSKKLQFIDKFTGLLISFFKLIDFKSFPRVYFLHWFFNSIWIDRQLTNSAMCRSFYTFTYSWMSSHRNCVGLLLRSNHLLFGIRRCYELIRVMRRVESIHLNIMIFQIFHGWRWSFHKIIYLLMPSTTSTTLRILNYLISLKCFRQLKRLKWILPFYRCALAISKKVFTWSFSWRQTNFRSLTKLVRYYIWKKSFGYNIINFTIITFHSGHSTLLFTDPSRRRTLIFRSAFISVWGLGSRPNSSLTIATLALPLAIYEHLYYLCFI